MLNLHALYSLLCNPEHIYFNISDDNYLYVLHTDFDDPSDNDAYIEFIKEFCDWKIFYIKALDYNEFEISIRK